MRRFSAVSVTGDSMVPTLHSGDLLVVVRTPRIRRGDLVMARRPDRPALLLVKRVLARESTGWWIEGDNPARSDDSRLFGPVPDHCLLGRVVLRYWPPSHGARPDRVDLCGSPPLRPG